MRIPVMMAVALCIAALCTDLYIFADIRKNFPRHKSASLGYAIFAVAGWIFVAICLLLPRRDNESSITFQMWGLYAFLSLLLPKIVFTLFSLAGALPRLWKSRGIKLGKWVGLPLAMVIFTAMWWGALIGRRQIEVVNVDIVSPRLPEAFEGYRIAQISDLHVGTWGDDTSFVDALVDSVNACRPDVIFFTGDIVNRQTGELAPFMKSLSRLHAPGGVYSILGNHDYGDYIDWPSAAEKRDNLQLLKYWQRQLGWKLLNNTRTQIISGNDTIQIIGVENWGEPPFFQYGHLIDAYPLSPDSLYNLNDNRFKILLTHNPEHWRREVTRISNIDLSLSGHTHAMQTIIGTGKLRWSPASMRYELWGGLYKKRNPHGDEMQLYVNIGAGEVGMPFRIGATPEITILTLHAEK